MTRRERDEEETRNFVPSKLYSGIGTLAVRSRKNDQQTGPVEFV